ncbi:hypothetical protein [Myroides odoratimimus]|uniref:hypothetical protein n=1 Tax=Myroides odoratimimus TaxID=76832 RepID=UPI0025775B31|nr:hypothetical protein [Myroides odoratimimus]MDM1521197.1 hypothetical protein [Myroides odoratimimus]
MIDFFERRYSRLRKINKIESLLRYLVRVSSNITLPIYFHIFKRDIVLPKVDRGQQSVIVSLTTFPGRISKLWLVIESILRQSLLPNEIVVWLSVKQFPNKIFDLPQNLKLYIDKGLVKFVFVDEDLRSHKKYYYAFKEYRDELVITLDDDIFYPSYVLHELVDLSKIYPISICSSRAFFVEKNFSNSELLPYSKWSKVDTFNGPCLNMFHTSGAGTLYRPSLFSDEVFNQDVILNKCFQADDVWLNIMAQREGILTVKTNRFTNLLPILSNSMKLSEDNVDLGGNDKQINDVLNYYNISQRDVFKKV